MNDKKLDLILNELKELRLEQREMRQEQREMQQEQREMKNEQMGMRQEFMDQFKIIDQKLDGIYEQVATTAENITQLQMDTKLLIEVQERQERTIDLLSRRSLDQEAEIKRIK